MKIFNEYKEF